MDPTRYRESIRRALYRFGIVLGDARAVVVHESEGALRVRFALLGQRPPFLQCRRVVTAAVGDNSFLEPRLC